MQAVTIMSQSQVHHSPHFSFRSLPYNSHSLRYQHVVQAVTVMSQCNAHFAGCQHVMHKISVNVTMQGPPLPPLYDPPITLHACR